ncbi:cache domain-containing sensor histidine kinase [Cohnella nanjingensis]|uniref:histidine kinase n=1 Tax=Cohnella nanjingensis TaxID=1387779 RepID=A0A7X0RQ08_9BACL|nr:sensor histidine kinase [Cohnella nanjingensis]MBB6671421.1 sensor histidine kinase [Cohnella nanjingensis]
MMNRPRHRQPWKISTILYALLFGMVVLPIGLISATILREYKLDLLKQTSARTLQTLRSATYSEEQEIGKAATYSAAVAMDKEVLGYATRFRQSAGQERQDAFTLLTKALDKYGLSMSGHVLSVNFFFKDGGAFSYMKDMTSPEAELRTADWYRNAKAVPDRVHFIGMQTGVLYDADRDDTIATAISPSALQMLHDIDMIYFVFNRDAFEEALRQNPYSRTSQFLLSTGDGRIVASSANLADRALPAELQRGIRDAKEGSFIAEIGGRKTLVAFTTVETAGWKTVYQIPYGELTANYSRMFRFVLIATLIIIAVFLLLSFYLVHRFAKPIRALVMKMSRVTQGYLNAKVEASGSREMVLLGHAFNHMMDRIKALIRQREEEEKAKRKAEFAALQSQINPHFMINTLNSIRLMALISNQDNIRKMTHALIRLLSSSFNRGGSYTLLSEEVENLKQYLFIMETRYGNQFDVVWDVDRQALDYSMLKLLLQPILENSIVHGLSGKRAGGRIRIVISKDDRALSIEIADDGVGMTEAQIASFGFAESAGNDAFSGMGIANVHRRIQLHHGPDYGIAIARNAWGGTTVRIRCPLVTAEAIEEGA